MFESIINFFKSLGKKDVDQGKSKDAAKERLHLVLMQDRANVSADFLDLMKQEIIEVIKKYIDVEENSIDVRLTNKTNGDGTTGAPALYANIPIVSIREDIKNKIARENDEKAEHIIPDNNEKKEQVEEKEINENVEENKINEQSTVKDDNTEETKIENKTEEQITEQGNTQNIEESSHNKENLENKQGDTCEEQNS